MRQEIRKALLSENELELTQLKKDNQEKALKVKELQSQELQLRKEKQQLQEAKEALGLEVQRRIDAERKEIESNARKSEQQALQLTLKEKDNMLEKLSIQLSDLQMKIDQGSTQSQGEVQEVELEKLLSATFPTDTIREVPKGVNGADCLQIVHDLFGKECGTIIYESKRTKNFDKKWVDKLKSDMRVAKADVSILVTEVMPKDMEEFGIRDGVLICRFNDVRALSALVRDSVIRVAEVKVAQENRGEKKQLLYTYLTSNEFFQHFHAVVTSFQKMKGDIDSEKRAMKTIWSRREKELELIIDSTVHMYGSIKGIAGNAIGEIKDLELPTAKNYKLLDE